MNRRRTDLLSLLNLHIAGVVLLAAVNLFFAVRTIVAWRDASSDRQAQIEQDQFTLKQLRDQAAHLNGLPEKVDQARNDASGFYKQRIAPDYSSIVSGLGDVAVHSGVRLTRASYSQAPAIPGLAEIRIDANMSGEYTGVMHFINGLERDKTFFLIDGLTLTGQQGGLANLRLRLTTFLRSDAAAQPKPASVAELQPAATEAH